MKQPIERKDEKYPFDPTWEDRALSGDLPVNDKLNTDPFTNDNYVIREFRPVLINGKKRMVVGSLLNDM